MPRARAGMKPRSAAGADERDPATPACNVGGTSPDAFSRCHASSVGLNPRTRRDIARPPSR
jgi:hypothetical protein